MNRRIGFLAVLLLMVSGWNACGGGPSATPPPPPPPVTVTSVAVSAPASSVNVGFMLPLTGTAAYSDGSSKDVTSQAVWSSSQTANATVSTLGVVDGVSAVSSVTITAAFGGKSGQTALTVVKGT